MEFLKNKWYYKILWVILILFVGLLIASSRVGVGAHYPLDVVTGSSTGYILGISGIKIVNRIRWFRWIKYRKYHPFFIVTLTAWAFVLIKKIIDNDHSPVFYVSFVSLIVSLFLITKRYVKKHIQTENK